ncbi:FAD-dependent oxidoreductase [Streptomyces celluloflavus]|uniref:FAD-dependent oxidoreductase n=1 Tax=Streptomyces celluloflavus TaxID=58344 RepID=UPI003685341B
MSGIVVIGTGPAGHRLVTRLRRHDGTAAVRVIGAERRPAYNRVLLTDVLAGRLRPGQLELPAHDGGVRVHQGVTALGIDRRGRLVHTDDGRAHGYDRLVLATGARPVLPVLRGLLRPDGGMAEGAATVRTLADAARLPGKGPAVVLGGGVLGVETALALRRSGRDVVLVHRNRRLMNRQLDDRSADLLAGQVRSEGVVVECGRRVRAFAPGRVLLDDGRTVPCAALLVCAGVRPVTGLARTAGLGVRRGVVVDGLLRTSDPRIHAIGDCAEYDGTVAGRVTAAWDQADTLAALLTGGTGHYRGTPPATRLRGPRPELAVIGRPDASGAETVLLSDSERYARLVLDAGGRLLGGILFGLPEAAAAAGQHYAHGLPLPPARLAFLLGTRPVRTAPARPADDLVVCHCNIVTRGQLAAAWRSGSTSAAQLVAATRATTGCGGCLAEITEFSRELAGNGAA